MEIEQLDDGHARTRLGKVERLVITAAIGLLVFLLGFVFHNFDGRLETSEKTMQVMVTQQAVTNSKLEDLSKQLVDVPGLTQEIAKLQVQVDRNTQDIRELQQGRKSQ